jgi:hypothetical protein
MYSDDIEVYIISISFYLSATGLILTSQQQIKRNNCSTYFFTFFILVLIIECSIVVS